MSDKVELIAAAQVNVVTGPPGAVTFNSKFGFESASYTSLGVYNLELEHEHGTDKLVVGVTRNNTAFGAIEASVLDKKHIQVNNFQENDIEADSSFFITVHRVRD